MKKILTYFISLSICSLASADSYWNHNGSIMRLSSYGSQRVFTYEILSDKMLNTGVTKGTVLFEGQRIGKKYVGIARVFSKYCDFPLTYKVNGEVITERKVILSGSREVYAAGCVPTGHYTKDKLIFTYISSK